MSLRQQLDKILPSLLPANPEHALKGTELIRLVRLRLEGDYSDASLRFHFSALAGELSSPLAKVEKSQGYYLRGAFTHDHPTAAQQPLFTSLAIELLGEDAPLEVQRRQKAQAIALLYYEQTRLTPYLLSPPPNSEPTDPWITPDLLLVDAPLIEEGAELRQDKERLLIRQLMGQPLLPLHSVSLVLIPHLSSCRQDFFQALSATSWTHEGELLFVEPLMDDALVQILRELGSSYGLAVSSLGLSMGVLDELPPAHIILESNAECSETLLSRLNFSHLVPARRLRAHIEESTLDALLQNSPHISNLLNSLHTSYSGFIRS